MTDIFAEVLLPIPIRERFTYRIPEGSERQAMPLMRVIVPLGMNKQSVGLITAIHHQNPAGRKVKDIVALPDDHPFIHPLNFKLWQWMARYYLCPEGDLLKAAVPAGLQPDRSRPKLLSMVFPGPEADSPEKWDETLGKLNRAAKQKELLLHFAGKIKLFTPEQLAGIPKAELTEKGRYSVVILNQLIAKRILQIHLVPVSRLVRSQQEESGHLILNSFQEEAFEKIRQQFPGKRVVLLHGFNGSGKTWVYSRYIREILETGKQILYLVPEIAHALQAGNLLLRLFGNQTGIFHSGMSEAERAETWNEVYRFKEGQPSSCQIILGTRSSIFLPFSKLGLIIVDDEHDSSYKQTEPSPRYHARDMAIMLGSQHQCPVVLGSATPSFESLHNAETGKYGLVTLQERYAGLKPPEIVLSDLTRARKKRQMHTLLTPELYAAMEDALRAGEQIILIQNRRGYASFLACGGCGHIPVCPHCNVKLTSHLSSNRMVCHYCGYKIPIPETCPVCGSPEMKSRGLGTEKAETEMAALFPNARISRLDMDTAPTRHSLNRIISRLENKETDILVGTQMVTRGMNISNIRLVGILNADAMLHIPDFRSWEKAYQFVQQVIGRLMREEGQGKIILQSAHPELPFYHYLINQDYQSMYNDLSEERKAFRYPPWYRLIRIILKHKNAGQLETISAIMAGQLRTQPYIHILGPEAPEAGKQKGLFIREIWIKAPRTIQSSTLQKIIPELTGRIKKMPGNSNLTITVDSDPV